MMVKIQIDLRKEFDMQSAFFYGSLGLITTACAFGYQKSGKKVVRNLFLALTILIPSIFAGIRVGIGTDYYIHYLVYNDIVSGRAVEKQAEVGYIFLNWLVNFLGGNYQVVLFLVTLLSMCCLMYALNTFRKSVSISFAVFCFMFLYYQMSYNYIRQLFAASIVLVAIVFCWKGRRALSLVIVALAATVHITGLIILPYILFFHFFSERRYSKQVAIVYLLCCLALLIYRSYGNTIIRALMGYNSQLDYYLKYLYVRARPFGFGVLRYPLMFIVPVLACWKSMRMESRWFYNICLGGFIFWLTSKMTIMEFYRISYSLLYLLPFLLGWLWKNCRTCFRNFQVLMYFYFPGIVLFFWYYDFFVLRAQQTVPYRSLFFTLPN